MVRDNLGEGMEESWLVMQVEALIDCEKGQRRQEYNRNKNKARVLGHFAQNTTKKYYYLMQLTTLTILIKFND